MKVCILCLLMCFDHCLYHCHLVHHHLWKDTVLQPIAAKTSSPAPQNRSAMQAQKRFSLKYHVFTVGCQRQSSCHTRVNISKFSRRVYISRISRRVNIFKLSGVCISPVLWKERWISPKHRECISRSDIESAVNSASKNLCGAEENSKHTGWYMISASLNYVG